MTNKLNPDILSKDELAHYGAIGEVEGLSPIIARRIFDDYQLPMPGWELRDSDDTGEE